MGDVGLYMLKFERQYGRTMKVEQRTVEDNTFHCPPLF